MLKDRTGVRTFFAPNITGWGRVVRAIWGLACIAGSIAVASYSLLACVVLLLCGAFGLLEAVCGWCVMRACGVKTKV